MWTSKFYHFFPFFLCDIIARNKIFYRETYNFSEHFFSVRSNDEMMKVKGGRLIQLGFFYVVTMSLNQLNNVSFFLSLAACS